MSSNDPPPVIEDEPYEGLYRDQMRPRMLNDSGHLPDRFDLAEILKKRRGELGLSLEEVAEMTRVRRNYLEAFEQVAYDVLPPRAFALGYIKAYARALGLDEESLADMYRREVSEPTVRLHAPSGASLEDVKPNYRAYLMAAAGLVLAVVAWNVVQRQPQSHERSAFMAQLDDASWKAGVPNLYNGLMQMTRPAPAPRDQDVPAPYVTPGLEEGFASMMATSAGSEGAPVPVTDVLQARKAFNPQGAVYGVPPAQSVVTLQATKSVDLIVLDAAGTITFAQQLNAGEAYRLPAVDRQDMQIQVSDFKPIEIYYNGEYAGQMDSVTTTAGKLNAKAEQMAAVLDARQAQTGQVASVYRAASPSTVEVPKPEVRSTAPIPYLPAVRATPPPQPASSSVSSAAPVVPDAAPAPAQ